MLACSMRPIWVQYEASLARDARSRPPTSGVRSAAPQSVRRSVPASRSAPSTTNGRPIAQLMGAQIFFAPSELHCSPLRQSLSLAHSSSGVWQENAVPPQPGSVTYVEQSSSSPQSASVAQSAWTQAPIGSPHMQTCPAPQSLSWTQPVAQ
jgi:hypothetical protein